MITVMGATGDTGRETTRLLLDAGVEVRALGRSEPTLAALAGDGAEAIAGDAADHAFLTAAFRGADAVFTLLPYEIDAPDYHAGALRLGESIVSALRDAGVRHVVSLSSVGADRPAETGFVASLHAFEGQLRTLGGANVLILRAGWLFKNFYASLDLIKHEGIVGDSVAPDLPLPMVDTRDVAAVAARALRCRDGQGVVVRELLGERDLSYGEATRIIGERIGKPNLAYVQFPDAELAAALVRQGFSEDTARLQVELNRALNDGTIRSLEGRTAANTTPTRFEAFAAEFARAYREA